MLLHTHTVDMHAQTHTIDVTDVQMVTVGKDNRQRESALRSQHNSQLARGGDRRKRERYERVPITRVKLVLELDPVETERVKEGTQRLHDHQHAHCRTEESENADHHETDIARGNCEEEDAVVKDGTQLRVRETQRPET